MATPTRLTQTKNLGAAGYVVPNDNIAGVVTGSQMWGNPSANSATQYGNSVPYVLNKSFDTSLTANDTIPIAPIASGVMTPVSLGRLTPGGCVIVPFTGSDAGGMAELGNDTDHYVFFKIGTTAGPGGTVPIRIASLSAASSIDMDTPIPTTVTVAGLNNGDPVDLQAPFVAVDGTRGFMLRFIDGMGNQFLIPVDYALSPTQLIAAPVFPPSSHVNDQARWQPDYVNRTNRSFRLNLDGDGAVSLFTFDVDLGAFTITPTQIASVDFSFFTPDEQNVIFDATYGPMTYMVGPADPSLQFGVCWMDQTNEGTTPNKFYILAWDASTWTTFSYTGFPDWPNGRFTDVFGPAGMLVGDSTQVEPPQLFPAIDGSTNPATHWFVRSPYVDPAGIGIGPWGIEATTWSVFSSSPPAPAGATQFVGTHVGFMTAGHFSGGTK